MSLDAEMAAAPAAAECSALIVHPLSMYSGGGAVSACSPLAWLQAATAFQHQEVRQLVLQQQRSEESREEPRPPRALLDYTCDESVRCILSFLDGVSLCRARRVNRSFHRLGGEDALWLRLCQAEWSISPEQLRERPASFLELYKYACRSLKMLIRDFVEEQCLTSLQASFRIPREAAVMITRGASAV